MTVKIVYSKFRGHARRLTVVTHDCYTVVKAILFHFFQLQCTSANTLQKPELSVYSCVSQ
jgi:hypothetical protein